MGSNFPLFCSSNTWILITPNYLTSSLLTWLGLLCRSLPCELLLARVWYLCESLGDLLEPVIKEITTIQIKTIIIDPVPQNDLFYEFCDRPNWIGKLNSYTMATGTRTIKQRVSPRCTKHLHYLPCLCAINCFQNYGHFSLVYELEWPYNCLEFES